MKASAKNLRRLPIYNALATMPPLSHWPDRSQPFSYERSEVIRFIMETGKLNLLQAGQVFARASRKNDFNLIKCDPETKLWSGTGDTSKIIPE